MTRYVVTLRFQWPAWDEKSGIQYSTSAISKSDAIQQIRRQAERDGHTGRHRGRYWFSATEETD